MKELMTGNEAVARGAYEAGVIFASAYPGTPSTEILENTKKYKEIISEWATNEKVAIESSIGASIAGARSFAAMKHVGVNVAADPLFTYAYVGVNGGFVLISADEPGQHSSQNEQDNRNIAKMAKIAMLEPSDSQESKDMFERAFEISEEFDTPVLFRMTTRICHSKGLVELGERKEVGIKPYIKNVQKNVTVPAHSRIMRIRVEERINKLREFSNSTDKKVCPPESVRKVSPLGRFRGASIIPSFIRMILSVVSATDCSWVTIMVVIPVLLSSFSTSITSSEVLLSRAPVGSSARRTLGCEIIARAIATRCFCPPDISFG